jgi:hypothetical protein
MAEHWHTWTTCWSQLKRHCVVNISRRCAERHHTRALWPRTYLWTQNPCAYLQSTVTMAMTNVLFGSHNSLRMDATLLSSQVRRSLLPLYSVIHWLELKATPIDLWAHCSELQASALLKHTMAMCSPHWIQIIWTSMIWTRCRHPVSECEPQYAPNTALIQSTSYNGKSTSRDW